MHQKVKLSDQRGITGNHFFDYASCHTRLWMHQKGLYAGSDNVHLQLGRHIDDTSKPRNRKRFTMQGLCAIDYVEGKDGVEVHEVKKGRTPSEAHVMQLRFYLEIMHELTGVEVVGILHLPQSKRTQRIGRDPEVVMKAYEEIVEIVSGKCPKPHQKPICSGCKFMEFCWS